MNLKKRVIQAYSKISIFKDFHFVLVVKLFYLSSKLNQSGVTKNLIVTVKWENRNINISPFYSYYHYIVFEIICIVFLFYT